MSFRKTISFDRFLRWGICATAGLWLTGCSSAAAPPCPFEGKGDAAPSAGCFTTKGRTLLMVQGLNGKISLPGGSSQPGEAAQCTAYRETWEETGLHLLPGERLAIFDTGFHLYRCEQNGSSGVIDPPPRMEVLDAFYLGSEEFGDYEWRFPDQQAQLVEMLKEDGPRGDYDATTEATLTP
jgi:8-oxo-dGTP pyrophosphatase MutT (NUDIX family)